MDEAGAEYDCEGCAVVFDEDSDVVLEQGARSDETTKIADE